MIMVYPSDEKTFANNGLKILKPLKAMIRKEDNGDYYLDLRDNLDYIDYYQAGMIIRANTPWGYQGFRLQSPKIEGRVITVRAKHLYFDSANYLIEDSYVVDKICVDAMDHLNSATDIESPFTVLSDITTLASYRCIRHTLEEAFAVLVERYAGHLVRDNYTVKIMNTIGNDNNIVLSYGKNIQKLTVDEKWEEVGTKLLPVGKDGLKLPEVYLELSEELYDIPYSKIVSFDQSNIVEDDYKVDGVLDNEAYRSALINDLRNKGNAWLEEHKFPKVNYAINARINKVSDVGDLIYVSHPKCKVDITTNVIAIEYDCIRGEITKVEFGNFNNKLKNLIPNINDTIADEVEKSTGEIKSGFTKDIEDATNSIKSLLHDSYVINDDGNQLFVVDRLPKEDAVNVIRINSMGIGFSQNGINGTFNSAWSIDGTMNMQQIRVTGLIGDMIRGGTLKLGSNLNEAGILELYDESNRLISTFDKNGLRFNCSDNSYILINPTVGFAGYDANGVKSYWADKDEFHMKKAFVEEEITYSDVVRMIHIQNNVNNGIGFVPVV